MQDIWGQMSEVLRLQEEEAVRFLIDLVKTDTQVLGHGIEGGREGVGQELICSRLRTLGIEPDVYEPQDEKLRPFGKGNEGHNYKGRPNVVGTFHGSGGGRSLILNGHVDTMPAGDITAWSHAPWDGKVVDGRLYGVGTCDMKGGLAGLLMAMEAIKKAGVKLKGDVIFQSVVDEEGGGNGTLAAVAAGYRADGAVIAEPTGLDIYPAHMGFIFYHIKVKGKSLHSSRKWAGVSAIEKAIKIIGALEELEHRWLLTHRHPLLPGPNINVGEIHGGEAGSTVAPWCEFKLCLHYLPGHDAGKKTEEDVFSAINDCCQGDPWLRENPPEIIKYQEGAPFEVSPEEPLVQAALAAVEAEKGEANLAGMPAGCDARYFTDLAQMPCVIVGPGEPGQAHSIGESILLADYLQFIRAMARFIMTWCGYE